MSLFCYVHILATIYLYFRLKFIILYMIKTIVLQPIVLAELLTFGTSSYEVREDYIYPVTLSQPFSFAGGSHTTIYVRQHIIWASTRENLVGKVKFRLQQVLIQILSNKLTTKALIRSAQSGLQLCCSQTPAGRYSRVAAHIHLIWPVHWSAAL